jgi:hypothetical protein
MSTGSVAGLAFDIDPGLGWSMSDAEWVAPYLTVSVPSMPASR